MGREGSGPGSGQERVGGSGVAGGLCGAGGGWKVRPRVARSRADRLSKAPVAAGAGAPGLPEPAPPTPGEGGGGGGAGRGRRGCGGGGGGAAICPGAARLALSGAVSGAGVPGPEACA